jgi:glycosyltransferase involved in cell wall biosynthesis
LLWSQFGAYHTDRCEAVGRQLAGRAEVLAVEVATHSDTYGWDASGALAHAEKLTLFPNKNYDRLSAWQRFSAMWRVLRTCNTVFLGISYSQSDVIALSWLLRLTGTKLVMMSDSKFDDGARDSRFEFFKSLLLSPYRGAIVAGARQVEYFHFLRFHKRPKLVGYDTVSVERIRAEAAQSDAAPLPFEQRDFLYLGRFVAKKRVVPLVEAYAAYVERAGAGARRLVLAGDGPEEPAIRAAVARLGLADRVIFTGFLQGAAVAQAMDRALALLIVSTGEQWGLVVNEALALGLPVIANAQVGATDSLVRNLVNGYIVHAAEQETLVSAMLHMAESREDWDRMVQASHRLAERGDVGRLADAIEMLALEPSAEALARYQAYETEVLQA